VEMEGRRIARIRVEEVEEGVPAATDAVSEA